MDYLLHILGHFSSKLCMGERYRRKQSRDNQKQLPFQIYIFLKWDEIHLLSLMRHRGYFLLKLKVHFQFFLITLQLVKIVLVFLPTIRALWASHRHPIASSCLAASTMFKVVAPCSLLAFISTFVQRHIRTQFGRRYIITVLASLY